MALAEHGDGANRTRCMPKVAAVDGMKKARMRVPCRFCLSPATTTSCGSMSAPQNCPILYTLCARKQVKKFLQKIIFFVLAKNVWSKQQSNKIIEMRAAKEKSQRSCDCFCRRFHFLFFLMGTVGLDESDR